MPMFDAVALAQLDDAIEDHLPVLVAGEIVVGDEEPVEAMRQVLAQQLLDVVRRAAARLAALHVDDGAERALVRAAAAGVEAGVVTGGALEVVRPAKTASAPIRAPAARPCNCRSAAACAARRPAAPCRSGPLPLRRRTTCSPCRARLSGRPACPAAWRGSRRRGNRRSPPGCRPRAAGARCRRARGNWFDCTPTRPTMPKPSCSRNLAMMSLMRTRVLVSSIASMSMATSGPSTSRVRRVGGKRVDRGQRVRRDRASAPLDHIAVGVIMRRLDQHELEAALGECRSQLAVSSPLIDSTIPMR